MDSLRTSPESSATALTPPPATDLDVLVTATRLELLPSERVCDTPLSRRSVSPVEPSVGDTHSTRAQLSVSQAEEQLVEQYSLHSIVETGELQVVGELAKTTQPSKKKKRKRKTKGKTADAPVTPQSHPRRKTCAQPGEKKPLPASGSDQKEVTDPVKTPDTLEESVEAGLRDVSKMPGRSQQPGSSKPSTSRSKAQKKLDILPAQNRQVMEELSGMTDICSFLSEEFALIHDRLEKTKFINDRLNYWEDSSLKQFHSAVSGLFEQCEKYLKSSQIEDFERKITLHKEGRFAFVNSVTYFSYLYSVCNFIAKYHHYQGFLYQDSIPLIISERINSLCSPEGGNLEKIKTTLVRTVSSLTISIDYLKRLSEIAEKRLGYSGKRLEGVLNLKRTVTYSNLNTFLKLLEVSERELVETCSLETLQEKEQYLKKNIKKIMLSFSESPEGKKYLKFVQSKVEIFHEPEKRFGMHCMRYIALTFLKAPVADTLPALERLKILVNPREPDSVDIADEGVKQFSLNLATVSIDRCKHAVASFEASSLIVASYGELKNASESLKSLKKYWHNLFSIAGDETCRNKAREINETIAEINVALHKAENRIKAKRIAAEKMAKKLIAEVAGEAEKEARVEKVKHRPYLAKPGKILSAQKGEQPQQEKTQQEKPVRREIQENWQHLDNAITLLNSLGDKYDQLGECIRLFRIVDNRQAENVTAEQKAFALYGLYSVSLFNTRNTFKEIRPSMTFLSRYHETLLRGENPSVSDGSIFFSTLDTYKKGLEKYKTLLINTQEKLNQLVEFTFYSDNNLIEDQELLDSISEAQTQCTNAVLEVRRFSEKLPDLCRLRKKSYKGLTRTRPRQPVQPPGPVQLDQPPGPVQLDQPPPDSSDSKKIQCLLEQIQEASNSLSTSQEQFSEVCTKLGSLVPTVGSTVSV